MNRHKKIILLFSIFIFLSFYANFVYAQELSALVSNLNLSKDKEEQITAFKNLALFYEKQNTPKKALSYWEKAYELEKSSGSDLQYKTLHHIANLEQNTEEYEQAISTNKELLKYYQNSNQTQKEINTLNTLFYLNVQIQEYEKAKTYLEQVLAIQIKQQQQEEIANTYNNLAFLEKKLGNPQKANQNYQEALNIYQNLQSKSANELQKAALFINMGVNQSQIGDYKTAKGHFESALLIYQKFNKKSEEAQVHNYLAANYYINAKNSLALNEAEKAINIASKQGDKNVLAVSYKIFSQIYEEEGDFEQAKKYYEMYQKLKEEIEDEERKQKQDNLEREIAIEKKENEIKNLLAEKERQEAELKNQKLESEKKDRELQIKAKELEILKRDSEIQQTAIKNQQLEKEKAEQLLALTEQKRLSERQERLLEKRKEETEKQKLLTEKEKAEREEEKQIRKAIEKENSLKAEKLEQEQLFRKYALYVGIIIAALLVVALFGLWSSLRANKKLGQKNKEVEDKKRKIEENNQELKILNQDIQEKNSELLTMNEEMQQHQEEIKAQRDYVEQKNQELEQLNQRLSLNETILAKSYDKIKTSETKLKEQNETLETRNRQIHSSIKAAETIQQAILPYERKLNSLLNEYFIIYKPKDIVSGDFYWITEEEQNTILIVADCTGHGVPGAFMTMIGNTLLDKIVRLRKIYMPADILQSLHLEIQTVLRQKETGNNNGMDAVAINMQKIDDQKTKIIFTGAKNPLYYIPKGSDELKILNADRKAIGGYQNEEIHFRNQEIILEKGSWIYAGSDGFEDQNDHKRKKFGSKRLKEILFQNRNLTLQMQKQLLEESLEKHMEGTLQRDDILLIGIKQ